MPTLSLDAALAALQGEKTDRADVNRITSAVKGGHSISLRLLNYRKDGTLFWNYLTIVPVKLENGTVAKFIGVQVRLLPSCTSVSLRVGTLFLYWVRRM